ncbi:MAG TPA: C4-type zinc ribbon domain-containing protein [Bryobacteraceae bacterium]|nr:C4-type zinc ribbon domain-containing protein [Bryobacteraceae bacterium]
MTAEIELVTRLQNLDSQIAELEKEVAALPRHIAQIEKALDAHNRRLEADRAALSANQKDRKRLEDDTKVHDQKISKLKDQMLQAKTNEQYRAFQNEIDYAAREIRKAEDRILDLMGESEPLEANVKRAEAELKKERAQVEAEKQRARERTADDEQQLTVLRGERRELAAGMEPRLVRDYERIRRKWHGGSAVAEAVEGRCSACQIALRPQFWQDLRRGDQLMFCESCGRFLFYNPPVSFENEVAAAPPAAG